MPFKYILRDLLASTPNSVGALFVDDTGETVDLACSEFTSNEMKVLGAYAGLHIRRAIDYLPPDEHGDLDLLHIENEGLHLYARPLPEGYYLVLAQRTPGLTSKAKQEIRVACDALHRELFDDEG